MTKNPNGKSYETNLNGKYPHMFFQLNPLRVVTDWALPRRSSPCSLTVDSGWMEPSMYIYIYNSNSSNKKYKTCKEIVTILILVIVMIKTNSNNNDNNNAKNRTIVVMNIVISNMWSYVWSNYYWHIDPNRRIRNTIDNNPIETVGKCYVLQAAVGTASGLIHQLRTMTINGPCDFPTENGDDSWCFAIRYWVVPHIHHGISLIW